MEMLGLLAQAVVTVGILGTTTRPSGYQREIMLKRKIAAKRKAKFRKPKLPTRLVAAKFAQAQPSVLARIEELVPELFPACIDDFNSTARLLEIEMRYLFPDAVSYDKDTLKRQIEICAADYQLSVIREGYARPIAEHVRDAAWYMCRKWITARDPKVLCNIGCYLVNAEDAITELFYAPRD
jgi:hypothetical protein